jgi:hypothetical protein
MNDSTFDGTGRAAATKDPTMRFRRYLSAVLQTRRAGPRYDEARQDYQAALRAQIPYRR